MILYHALTDYDKFIDLEKEGLISKYVIEEVIKNEYFDGTSQKIGLFKEDELENIIAKIMPEIREYVLKHQEEVWTYLDLLKSKSKLFRDEAASQINLVLNSADDKRDKLHENWISLSNNPLDEKRAYDEQEECKVICVDTDNGVENLEIYPRTFSISMKNKSVYYTTVPSYLIAATLNACEYERVMYGISTIDEILTTKKNRLEQNKEYIDHLMSMYKSGTFEQFLIQEHLGKNRSLRAISNDNLDRSTVNTAWFINDSWDKVIKTYKKKIGLRD